MAPVIASAPDTSMRVFLLLPLARVMVAAMLSVVMRVTPENTALPDTVPIWMLLAELPFSSRFIVPVTVAFGRP